MHAVYRLFVDGEITSRRKSYMFKMTMFITTKHAFCLGQRAAHEIWAPEPEVVIARTLVTMKCWVAALSEKQRAEFPSFELVQSFSIFRPGRSHTRTVGRSSLKHREDDYKSLIEVPLPSVFACSRFVFRHTAACTLSLHLRACMHSVVDMLQLALALACFANRICMWAQSLSMKVHLQVKTTRLALFLKESPGRLLAEYQRQLSLRQEIPFRFEGSSFSRGMLEEAL